MQRKCRRMRIRQQSFLLIRLASDTTHSFLSHYIKVFKGFKPENKTHTALSSKNVSQRFGSNLKLIFVLYLKRVAEIVEDEDLKSSEDPVHSIQQVGSI